MNKYISIIIPVYNESGNLEWVCDEIAGVFDGSGLNYEIIFVDDGSQDNSSKILSGLSCDKIKAIILPKNIGKGYAILRGIEESRGDYLILMDGDGQIDPKYALEFARLLIDDRADLILGSKYHPESYYESTPLRKITGEAYNALIRLLLKYKYYDVQSGIKSITKACFKKLAPFKTHRFGLDLEIISRAFEQGRRIHEIPINVRPRKSGRSKINKYVVSLELLSQIFRLYFKKLFGKKYIYGNYQHRAMYRGSKIQKFWHSRKILAAKQLGQVSGDDVVLDAGCGSGNLCFALAPECRLVYGVDIFQDAVDFANNLKIENNAKNISFQRCCLEKLPFEDDSINKIFLLDVIEHVGDPGALLRELRRVLKKNGRIIITAPNYQSIWAAIEFIMDLFRLAPRLADEQHINKFNLESLAKLQEISGFSVKDMFTFYLFSPFIALFSSKLADMSFSRELRNKIRNGALIISVAQKC